MGHGGNLLWSAVLAAVARRDGRAPVVCATPGLSDLLAGRLYDGGAALGRDEIFRGNPQLAFPHPCAKPLPARLADAGFRALLRLGGLRERYEAWVHRRAERLGAAGGPHYIHVDMHRHSYAARQTSRRTFWKEGRAIDAIGRSFGLDVIADVPRLYFTAAEAEAVDQLLAGARIERPFVAIEPDTNREWFGELRAWPMDRWQELCRRLQAAQPALQIVQLGLGRSGLVAGAVDLTRRTSFRQAAQVIARSALFIGTESGLMHAARAVEAPALILWGGITLPEFIGYPDRQTTICKRVACAPCGNMGWCDNGHICMRDITVEEVATAALSLLGEPAEPRHPAAAGEQREGRRCSAT